MLRGKLNRLVRKTKSLLRTAIRGLFKECGDADGSTGAAVAQTGLDIMSARVENTQPLALLIRVGMVKLWKKETKQEGEEIDGAACIQA